MNYSSFDRFQGVWLGGIVGSCLALSAQKEQSIASLASQYREWIINRDNIARLILVNLNLESVITPLVELMTTNPEEFSSDRMLFELLPLVILAENNRNIYVEIITQLNLKSIQMTETPEDLLVWSYLITWTINNKFQLESSNPNLTVEQFLSGVGLQGTLVEKKFGVLGRRSPSNLSLQGLIEKLLKLEKTTKNKLSRGDTIIALAFYCFAATPRNFMLSVQRASHLNLDLALPVTLLTATLSGAYNGWSAIPRTWRFGLSRDRLYQEGDKTSRDLFAAWLGVLEPTGDRPPLYDLDLEAVAAPKIIQPRSSLKIISQKSDLG